MSSVGFTAAMDDALRSLAASDAAMKLATTELLAKDATIEQVRALHEMGQTRDQRWCQEDQQSWPCPTIRAIEETP
jgi:hypothetical protein